MIYHLSWLMTGAVAAAALVIGIFSAVLLSGVARTLWAVVISLGFVVVGSASVLLDASWMASEPQRLAAQTAALFLLLTGVIFTLRARD
jgi:hypothetical protein